VLTGKQFFPHLIADPFHHGLIIVFSAAIAMSLTGAVISLLRGRQYYYEDPVPTPASKPAAKPGDDTGAPAGAAKAGDDTGAPAGAGKPGDDAVAPVGAVWSVTDAEPVIGAPGPGSGPD
jgi:hypothetical protein